MDEVLQFESRKREHIRHALEAKNEAVGWTGLERIRLIPQSLPEINFSDVHLDVSLFGRPLRPFLISSMTAGHSGGVALNQRLARAAEKRRWVLGLGSQRRELFDPEAYREWLKLRELAPNAVILSNIGITQVIEFGPERILELVEGPRSSALVVHINPLQEVIQAEGTPRFAGGLEALKALIDCAEIPIILKETGCGFSLQSILQLRDLDFYALDVSGLGGTHWGRVEGDRGDDQIRARAAETFADWGTGTVDSVRAAVEHLRFARVWGSGGLRTGLDAAKLFALGAEMAGFAKPALRAALEGDQQLEQWMASIEFECQVGLFLSGARSASEMEARWEEINSR